LREEHGFTGGYTIVKDAVREICLRQQEVFIPLTHRPGEAQVDFGRVYVDLDEEIRAAAMFVMTLPYSGAIIVPVYPRECQEAFQDGHRRAFEFFGGVPNRISYDNLKAAVIKVIGSRKRELNRDFLRLKSHYLFESHFCRVGRPNENAMISKPILHTGGNHAKYNIGILCESKKAVFSAVYAFLNKRRVGGHHDSYAYL